MLGDVGLHEQHALLGIDAGGQEAHGHVQGAGGQLVHLVRLGDGVIVHDADEALVLILERHPVLDGAQVVAEVQLARGLDTGKDA